MKLQPFDLPIFAYIPSHWESKQSKLLELSEKCDYKKLENGGFFSTKGLTNIVDDIHDIFLLEFKEFAKESNYNDVNVEDAWFARYPLGSYQVPHTHTHTKSNWTGFAFVQNTEEDPTYLVPPFPNVYSQWTDHIDVNSREGLFYIIPNFLMHHVMKTKVDNRIVVAFDISCSLD